MRQDAIRDASTAGTPVGDQLHWLAERCDGTRFLGVMLTYASHTGTWTVVVLDRQLMGVEPAGVDVDLGAALDSARLMVERASSNG